MKPVSVWIASVLLALGVFGILDVAGVAAWSQTVGQWWPVAIVGWAVADMVSVRRVTPGGTICAAIGVAMLADLQAWLDGALVWSSLAIAVGLALLVAASLKRAGRHNGDAPAAD
jgi:hypothetical protein